MTHIEHNPDDHEDPAPGPTWLVAFIGTVLLVVTVLGVTAVYFGAADRGAVDKVQAVVPIELETLVTAQDGQIRREPHWLESEADGQIVDRRLVIPIDQAMELTVAEYGGP